MADQNIGKIDLSREWNDLKEAIIENFNIKETGGIAIIKT
jgi:hypothetical protein